ncbi:hypothetical protein BLNAU_11794 [Blattamonas nauphoetae]|uniref:Uncharacterized protein n=1 Tax=Blattamonas nauphoetae TaxID=2049346 RepID=A0ABQ9XLN3_9EUKA|nr:hypothetical protein BLNAU_11794 [Blattamonas nauphoetae]
MDVDQSDQDFSHPNPDSQHSQSYFYFTLSLTESPFAPDVSFPSQNPSPSPFDDDFGDGFADPEFWALPDQPIDETILNQSFSTQHPSAQQDERNEAVNDRAEMKTGSFSAYSATLRHPDADRSFPPVGRMTRNDTSFSSTFPMESKTEGSPPENEQKSDSDDSTTFLPLVSPVQTLSPDFWAQILPEEEWSLDGTAQSSTESPVAPRVLSPSSSAACQSALRPLFPSQCFQQTPSDADLGVQSSNKESWTVHNQVDDTILGESLSAQNPSPQQDERDEAVNDRAEMKQGSFPTYMAALHYLWANLSFPPLNPAQTGTAQPPFASQNHVTDYPNTERSTTQEGTKSESANAQRDGAPAKEPKKKNPPTYAKLAGLTLNEGPFVEFAEGSHVRVGKDIVRIERSVEIDRELEEKGIVGQPDRNVVQIDQKDIRGVTIDYNEGKKTTLIWLSFLVCDRAILQSQRPGKKYGLIRSSDLFGLIGSSEMGQFLLSEKKSEIWSNPSSERFITT